MKNDTEFIKDCIQKSLPIPAGTYTLEETLCLQATEKVRGSKTKTIKRALVT